MQKEKEEAKNKEKIVKLNEFELFGHYKYSSKNFPEGRDNFSFKYNQAEVVLFGGIVSNKNNFVWFLDPGKKTIIFHFYLIF